MKNKKKQKKFNFLIIPIPLYEVSVVIYFGVNLKKVIKDGVKGGIQKDRFDRNFKTFFEDNAKEGQGFCIDFGTGNKDVLVWIWKIPEKLSEYKVLYHELYHATDHIANSRNFNYEDKLSEPRAYLFGYLFNEVSLKLWK